MSTYQVKVGKVTVTRRRTIPRWRHENTARAYFYTLRNRGGRNGYAASTRRRKHSLLYETRFNRLRFHRAVMRAMRRITL